MPRWRILLALHEHAGVLSQKRLVERLKVDPGALTRQLKTLEGLGWIVRSVDARDNRVSNVTLTAQGRAIAEEEPAASQCVSARHDGLVAR